jgi:hypothetical protein
VQVVPGEPEAVVQPRKDGAMRPSYKPSLWAHASGLIVGQAVHPSSETVVVPQLLEQHEVVFDGQRPTTLLLDAAFCTTAVLERLVRADIDVLCPAGRTRGPGDWSKRGAHGRFGKGAFAYDAQRDAYRCPGQQWLTPGRRSRDRQGRPYVRYGTPACARCELRAQCTTSAGGRLVERYAGDEYKEAMAAVLRQPAARRRYRQRAAIGERPYAELRQRQGLVRFRRRGRAGAALEFALHCLAFDLKWAVGPRAGRRRAVIVALSAVSNASGRSQVAGLLIMLVTPPVMAVLAIRVTQPRETN